MNAMEPEPRSNNNTVHAIFLSEFDIDQGSVLRCQYPEEFLKSQKISLDVADYMLPEGAHNHDYDWTVFLLNRTKTEKNAALSDDWELVGPASRSVNNATSFSQQHFEERPDFPLLFCFNLTHTRKDGQMRRGATIKALSVACTHQFFHIYKTHIWRALQEMFTKTTKEEETAVMKRLFDELNAFPVAKALATRYRHFDLWQYFNTHPQMYTVTSTISKESLHIPLQYGSDEVEESSLSLILGTFKEKTMAIYESLLLEKRVMFLAPNLPSWSICRFVMSSVLLVQPLENLLTDRCFPYVHFGDASFLDAKGYIVGVSNPFFKDKDVYWDLLCDVTTGEVFESRSAGAASRTNVSSADKAFIKKVLTGIQIGSGEAWIRRQFKYYTQAIIDKSLGKPTTPPSTPTKSSSILGSNNSSEMTRVISWSHTRSYWKYMQSYVRRKQSIANMDIEECARNLQRIQASGDATADDVLLRSILQDFADNVHSPADVLELYTTLGSYSADLDEAVACLKLPLESSSALRLHSLRQRLYDIVKNELST